MATRWDADEWSERAVRALVPLAQSTTAQSYGAPPLASGEYRALARLAKSDERARAYFDHLLPKLNDDPQHLTDLVCSHPGIKSVVRGTGDERAVFLRMPSSGSLLQLNILVRYLAKSAIQNGPQQAVHQLERLLSLSLQGRVPGYEVTVFEGLTMAGEAELVPGLEVMDYRNAAERGLVRHEPPIPDETMPDYAAMGSLVLARQIAWGPCLIAPLTSKDAFPASPPEFRWSPDSSTGIVFDILSLCTSQQVQILSILHCAPEFSDVFGGLASGSSFGYIHSENLRRKPLAKEHICRSRKLLDLWSQFSSNNRDKLELAVSRLSSSVYRNRGRFWLQDRILDAGIALEMMYELDPPELTYKLATRAAHFLAEELGDRIKVFDQVHQFYDARSKVAHGARRTQRRGKKAKTIDPKEAADLGFSLASRTFGELLNRGDYPDDWKKMIM